MAALITRTLVSELKTGLSRGPSGAAVDILLALGSPQATHADGYIFSILMQPLTKFAGAQSGVFSEEPAEIADIAEPKMMGDLFHTQA